jgi:peroxiredoxin
MRTVIRRLFKQGKNNSTAPRPLPVGSVAPDFTLKSDLGESVSLSELRGQPVVLVFYPADNTSVCASQLVLYNEAYHLFEEHQAQLLGISVDGQASHAAFAASLGLRFPLLSDDDPVGQIARDYGVFDEDDLISERALFVLDDDGRIHWHHLSPRGVNPGANGILEALESLVERE